MEQSATEATQGSEVQIRSRRADASNITQVQAHESSFTNRRSNTEESAWLQILFETRYDQRQARVSIHEHHELGSTREF